MLIITNGDSAAAAIAESGLTGSMLPWRDVLHDGPVPANLPLADLSKKRARFIADCGWGDPASIHADFVRRDTVLQNHASEDEVVMWFEHDLYDQLQLLQLLDWFEQNRSPAIPLSLICHDRFVAEQPPDLLRKQFDERAPVSSGQLELARQAWQAFCAADPTQLVALSHQAHSELPFLPAALLRHCEEFPSIRNGLSRNERTVLEQVAAGVSEPVALFRACQDQEAARYLGDSSFWLIIGHLSRGSHRLIETTEGQAFSRPGEDDLESFRSQELRLTETGRSVLHGRDDWVDLNGVDHWRGGVHLRPNNIWRWDSDQETLIESDS